MEEFFTLDDFDFKGKTVLLRVDLNVPYDKNTGRIEDSERIREHAKTLDVLLKKGARVVVLAHQGRKGDEDFIHLDQHADLLSKHLGQKVRFVDDVVGEKALDEIRKLRNEEAILLDNVRFLDDETEEKSIEEQADSQIVRKLSPLADFFVNDAFSVSHRSHASVVGFVDMPNIAGRVMEMEIKSIDRAFITLGINTFILGGAKPEDCISIIEYFLNKKPAAMENVLTGGLLANIFLIAAGFDVGEESKSFLEKKGYLQLVGKAKGILEKFPSRIFMPEDMAIEENGKRVEILVGELPAVSQIIDIGKRTVEKYSRIVKTSRTIVWKGPLGVYERKGFEWGTKKVLEAVARSNAFSLIGGGDTGVAIEKLNVPRKKFSYISLAGGALISYLSGKPMPGIDALKMSYRKFKTS